MALRLLRALNRNVGSRLGTFDAQLQADNLLQLLHAQLQQLSEEQEASPSGGASSLARLSTSVEDAERLGRLAQQLRSLCAAMSRHECEAAAGEGEVPSEEAETEREKKGGDGAGKHAILARNPKTLKVLSRLLLVAEGSEEEDSTRRRLVVELKRDALEVLNFLAEPPRVLQKVVVHQQQRSDALVRSASDSLDSLASASCNCCCVSGGHLKEDANFSQPLDALWRSAVDDSSLEAAFVFAAPPADSAGAAAPTVETTPSGDGAAEETRSFPAEGEEEAAVSRLRLELRSSTVAAAREAALKETRVSGAAAAEAALLRSERRSLLRLASVHLQLLREVAAALQGGALLLPLADGSFARCSEGQQRELLPEDAASLAAVQVEANLLLQRLLLWPGLLARLVEEFGESASPLENDKAVAREGASAAVSEQKATGPPTAEGCAEDVATAALEAPNFLQRLMTTYTATDSSREAVRAPSLQLLFLLLEASGRLRAAFVVQGGIESLLAFATESFESFENDSSAGVETPDGRGSPSVQTLTALRCLYTLASDSHGLTYMREAEVVPQLFKIALCSLSAAALVDSDEAAFSSRSASRRAGAAFFVCLCCLSRFLESGADGAGVSVSSGAARGGFWRAASRGFFGRRAESEAKPDLQSASASSAHLKALRKACASLLSAGLPQLLAEFARLVDAARSSARSSEAPTTNSERSSFPSTSLSASGAEATLPCVCGSLSLCTKCLCQRLDVLKLLRQTAALTATALRGAGATVAFSALTSASGAAKPKGRVTPSPSLAGLFTVALKTRVFPLRSALLDFFDVAFAGNGLLQRLLCDAFLASLKGEALEEEEFASLRRMAEALQILCGEEKCREELGSRVDAASSAKSRAAGGVQQTKSRAATPTEEVWVSLRVLFAATFNNLAQSQRLVVEAPAAAPLALPKETHALPLLKRLAVEALPPLLRQTLAAEKLPADARPSFEESLGLLLCLLAHALSPPRLAFGDSFVERGGKNADGAEKEAVWQAEADWTERVVTPVARLVLSPFCATSLVQLLQTQDASAPRPLSFLKGAAAVLFILAAFALRRKSRGASFSAQAPSGDASAATEEDALAKTWLSFLVNALGVERLSAALRAFVTSRLAREKLDAAAPLLLASWVMEEDSELDGSAARSARLRSFPSARFCFHMFGKDPHLDDASPEGLFWPLPQGATALFRLLSVRSPRLLLEAFASVGGEEGAEQQRAQRLLRAKHSESEEWMRLYLLSQTQNVALRRAASPQLFEALAGQAEELLKQNEFLSASLAATRKRATEERRIFLTEVLQQRTQLQALVTALREAEAQKEKREELIAELQARLEGGTSGAEDKEVKKAQFQFPEKIAAASPSHACTPSGSVQRGLLCAQLQAARAEAGRLAFALERLQKQHAELLALLELIARKHPEAMECMCSLWETPNSHSPDGRKVLDATARAAAGEDDTRSSEEGLLGGDNDSTQVVRGWLGIESAKEEAATPFLREKDRDRNGEETAAGGEKGSGAETRESRIEHLLLEHQRRLGEKFELGSKAVVSDPTTQPEASPPSRSFSQDATERDSGRGDDKPIAMQQATEDTPALPALHSDCQSKTLQLTKFTEHQKCGADSNDLRVHASPDSTETLPATVHAADVAGSNDLRVHASPDLTENSPATVHAADVAGSNDLRVQASPDSTETLPATVHAVDVAGSNALRVHASPDLTENSPSMVHAVDVAGSNALRVHASSDLTENSPATVHAVDVAGSNALRVHASPDLTENSPATVHAVDVAGSNALRVHASSDLTENSPATVHAVDVAGSNALRVHASSDRIEDSSDTALIVNVNGAAKVTERLSEMQCTRSSPIPEENSDAEFDARSASETEEFSVYYNTVRAVDRDKLLPDQQTAFDDFKRQWREYIRTRRMQKASQL